MTGQVKIVACRCGAASSINITPIVQLDWDGIFIPSHVIRWDNWQFFGFILLQNNFCTTQFHVCFVITILSCRLWLTICHYHTDSFFFFSLLFTVCNVKQLWQSVFEIKQLWLSVVKVCGTIELFVDYLIICKLLVHGYWLVGHSKTRRGEKEESETFPTATLLPCCHQLWTIYLATKHEPTMKLKWLSFQFRKGKN